MSSFSPQSKPSLAAKYNFFDGLLLFCLAFFLRGFWILRNQWLTGDSEQYLAIAKNLAFHHAFSFGQVESVSIPTAFRPPLYPALISLFWWYEEAPVTVVLFFQALLGAITVLLAYQIANRHFGRRVAIIAAIAISIEPFTINYTATIMTETLFTFLVVLAAYISDYKRYALAGFIFGLAALTRPTVLPFLLLLPLLSIFPLWKTYRKAFLTIFLIASATVSVWTIRNIVAFNQIIPVSSFGFGMNFLCGTIDVPMLNDEGWDIVYKDPAIQQMRQDLKDGMPETKADQKLFREGLQRIVSNPLSWLKVRAKQYTRLYIDSAPYILGGNNMPFEEAIRDKQWLFIVYKLALTSRIFILIALFWIGIFLARDRISELSNITLFPIFLMLIHIPLWSENRYLLPLVPFVCIMAAYTLDRFLIKFGVLKSYEQTAILIQSS